MKKQYNGGGERSSGGRGLLRVAVAKKKKSVDWAFVKGQKGFIAFAADDAARHASPPLLALD